MPIATPDSWTHLPAPARREPLHFQARYTANEYERLRLGVIPREMEDKWFIYLHDGWLRLHRSWTGNWIYALRLEQDGADWLVTDSWVNRDPEQYRLTDGDYDRKTLQSMMQWLINGPQG